MRDFAFWEKESRDDVAKAATGTLTADELDHTLVRATGTITLTMPTVTAAMKNFNALIVNADSGVITLTGTFGGHAAFSVALAQGQMAMVFCDGVYWHVLHHTAAA